MKIIALGKKKEHFIKLNVIMLPDLKICVNRSSIKLTNLAGKGRSATAWDNVAIAACCCSVNGAFCIKKIGEGGKDGAQTRTLSTVVLSKHNKKELHDWPNTLLKVLVKAQISIKPSLHDINSTMIQRNHEQNRNLPSIHKFTYDQNNAHRENSMDINVDESKFCRGGV